MKFLKFIFAGTIALVSFSCKTSYRISVKEPAVIKVPDEVQVFGVINNVNDANSPDKIISTVLGQEQINGNVVASERAVDGVLRGLSNSETLRGEIIEGDSIFSEPGVLDWDYLDSIAVLRGIDGYIELSELKTMSPTGGTVLGNVNGQTRQRLEGTIFVNVHLVESEQRFERYSAWARYNIPTSGSTNIMDILNDMQRKREYYGKLGFTLGHEIGKMLYPNWVWVGRTYYTRGSRALKASKPMLKNGNWDIAEKQLLQDEHNGKLKKRGRVLYNLALAKEGQGDIDAAIMYAERSALECYNKEANKYLVKLRQRKRQMEKI
jgi:hypothetical protein